MREKISQLSETMLYKPIVINSTYSFSSDLNLLIHEGSCPDIRFIFIALQYRAKPLSFRNLQNGISTSRYWKIIQCDRRTAHKILQEVMEVRHIQVSEVARYQCFWRKRSKTIVVEIQSFQVRKLPNLHGYMILNTIVIEFQYLQMNQLAYLGRYRTCKVPSCQISAQPHVK